MKTFKEAYAELAGKIKQIFADASATTIPDAVVTSQDTPLTEYTLEDGTVLKIDQLAVDGMVTINDAPAPDGDYKLPDGTKITVASGKITAVELPTPAPVTQQFSSEEDFIKVFQEFGTGTPEERITKIETVVKALFEYSFGWKIREAQEKANIDNAIAVYKQGFESQVSALAEQNKALQQKIALMQEGTDNALKLIELMGSELQGEPLGGLKGDEGLTRWEKHQQNK